MNWKNDREFARSLDAKDSLRSYREKFYFPMQDGKDILYFSGNSLGLQPKTTRSYIEQEIDDWARLGSRGHVKPKTGWVSYHELLINDTAKLVGAKPDEVVNMNSLTVNLHLMMVSFFRPTASKYKILMEAQAFPSDQYAVQTQLKFHNLDPAKAVIEAKPRTGEHCVRTEDILQLIERHGHELALVLIGGVQYLTGQAFDLPAITKAAHAHDCLVGFDLAHWTGNIPLALHDWQVDFAAWCSYKYLNSGPGGLAGVFVHEDQAARLPVRFGGWWGHNKERRFLMEPEFDPIVGAQGWQLSNPPIFQAAALRASLELFSEVGMPALRKKSEALTGYLEFLIEDLKTDRVSIITPKDPQQRGAQLSLKVKGNHRELAEALGKRGIICDFRSPDIIRAAPAPFYNSFEDVYLFASTLGEVLDGAAS